MRSAELQSSPSDRFGGKPAYINYQDSYYEIDVAVDDGDTSAYPVFRRGSSDSRPVCPNSLNPVARDIGTATTAVRCRPRTTGGGESAVVPTAMTWLSMGPHWPGHSPTRETNESSPGVSPVPSECGLEPKGGDRPNLMVGFPRLQAREEVNRPTSEGMSMVCGRASGLDASVRSRLVPLVFRTNTRPGLERSASACNRDDGTPANHSGDACDVALCPENTVEWDR